MGFFANPSPFSDSAAGLEQLSIARVKSALDRVEINYTIDDDGDLGAGWELGVIYFLIRGNQNEIFHVQGFWRAQVEANQRSEADEFCNEWNSSRLWPRTLARVGADGLVRMETDLIMDYEDGLTDSQLDRHIMSAVSSMLGFFEALIQRFPEAWQQALGDN